MPESSDEDFAYPVYDRLTDILGINIAEIREDINWPNVVRAARELIRRDQAGNTTAFYTLGKMIAEWVVEGEEKIPDDPERPCNHTVCSDREDNQCVVVREMELVDNHHGVYIPQVFAQRLTSVALGMEIIQHNIPQSAVNILLEGPDDPDYWSTWERVINNTSIVDREGWLWRLADLYEGAPDLFAVAYIPDNHEHHRADRVERIQNKAKVV